SSEIHSASGEAATRTAPDSSSRFTLGFASSATALLPAERLFPGNFFTWRNKTSRQRCCRESNSATPPSEKTAHQVPAANRIFRTGLGGVAAGIGVHVEPPSPLSTGPGLPSV